MLKKCALFFLVLSIVVVSSNVYADGPTQHKEVMTTYYPAPFGEYQKLYASGVLGIGMSATATNNYHFASDLAGGVAGLRLYNGNYGGGNHLLTILPNGRVGIGQTQPVAELDVTGTLLTRGVIESYANGASDWNAGLMSLKDSGNDNIWTLSSRGTTDQRWNGSNRRNDLLIAYYDKATTTWHTPFNIASGTQNVGIGIRDPETKLHVAGGAIKAQGGLVLPTGGANTGFTCDASGANCQNGELWVF